MEHAAASANLITRSVAGSSSWQIANRIAIEELEAWYFGDWDAVRATYARVSASIPGRTPYRSPDAIEGGTWEAFERVLQSAGYFKGGLRKTEVARELGHRIDPLRNGSPSFARFYQTIVEAIA